MTGSCKDDQTFVGTFDSPYPDYEGLYNSDILPAHILEKGAGIADITKLTPASSPEDLTEGRGLLEREVERLHQGAHAGRGPVHADRRSSRTSR